MLKDEDNYDKYGIQTESFIQKQIVQWLNMCPKTRGLVIHIPNEGKRSVMTGANLKAMGMKKGTADLFIALPSKGYHGAWIELKTKKGRVAPSQKEFLDTMSKQGYFTAVCFGYEDAVNTIAQYCDISFC